ncbi:hypothetical protein [Pseudomonas sp. NBRC 111118]|uniref:hypothetical protein n=1 Tax=Pseudomonas sp. NBRC 111118 TaxID=1661033 RepID=UPI000A4937BF|nr:hypothetical protein [Pseudomonas sp. NBRC 111118]
MENNFYDELKEFDETFDGHSVNIISPSLAKGLANAQGHYNKRKPHVVFMKRKSRWSTEDVRQAFNYNEHNFKLINEYKRYIKFFELYIEMLESSEHEPDVKTKRIKFSQECIMKIHRIIAIYKATIMTA